LRREPHPRYCGKLHGRHARRLADRHRGRGGIGFDRGFVTYTKESKAELLGIEPSLLEQNEAVSEVLARAMAEGALKRGNADFALGITGFCRPGGTTI